MAVAVPAAKYVTPPKIADAPFNAMVSDVISCVVVISTVVPSGTPVLSGNVIVPAASVPAGCRSIHWSLLTGVGTVMLKPLPGTKRFTANVGDAKLCWKNVSKLPIDVRRASPLLGE